MSVRLIEQLVKAKVIPQQDGEKALDQQKTQGGSICGILVQMGLLEEQEFVAAVSKEFGVPIVELDDMVIHDDVIQLLPASLANKHGIIPIVRKDRSITLAMTGPSNIVALNDAKFITGLDVEVAVTSPTQFKNAYERLYDQGSSLESIIGDMEEDDVELVDLDDSVNLNELEKATEDAPVVKLVNAILTDAIKKNASDIHLEPYEKSLRARFRIDGVLYEIMRPPLKLKNALTSRIKIMADLYIAERRLPQDGRIKLRLGSGKEMDYRVNVLPTLFGEKVVLRLLDKSNLQLDMQKLGFESNQLKHFKEAISKPHGMVLVTGPTGSGKTTTLYSALAELNQVGTNISTAEDPVEFNLSGINQAQMNDDIGFNFAAALRAFLRQDPDVIMVGEIRDYETAEIAIKASLTGHLVLSTLHTNDAPSTVNRLLNMGVEPLLVASSINLIVAQRLARKICTDCAEDIEVDPEVLIKIGVSPSEAAHMKLKKGKGCPKCSDTGYRGRIALYEVMPMSEELKEFVLNGASSAELGKEAVRLGMLSLRASGLLRLREGITTVEEVLRVTSGE